MTVLQRLETILQDMKNKLQEEQHIQKRFAGPENDSLLAISFGKMMVLDHCIRELEPLVIRMRLICGDNSQPI